MKNNQQVDVTLVFSFLAFVIIILGFFFKTAFLNEPAIRNEPTQSSHPTISKKNSSSALDYNKPITCDYQTKESSISANIDGNAIFATFKESKATQNYLVAGDCLYIWDINGSQGTKKCGIGSSVAIGKQVLSSGLGSIDSLTSMIPQSSTTSSIDFQAVFESCKNVKEVNGGMFAVPKSVVFK